MTELQRHKEAVAYVIVQMRKQLGLDLAHVTENIITEMGRILNPPPAVETVDVVRWECDCGNLFKEHMKQCPCCGDTGKMHKLTGTLTREVQKVERSVEGRVSGRGGMVPTIHITIPQGDVPPMGATVSLVWEDQ